MVGSTKPLQHLERKHKHSQAEGSLEVASPQAEMAPGQEIRQRGQNEKGASYYFPSRVSSVDGLRPGRFVPGSNHLEVDRSSAPGRSLDAQREIGIWAHSGPRGPRIEAHQRGP